MPDFSSPLTLLAAALCLGLALSLPWGIVKTVFRKIPIKLLGGIYAWFVFASVLAALGFLQFKRMPPPAMILVFTTLIISLFGSLHKSLGPRLEQAAWQQLILLQSFRLPVEIFLWLLFLDNIVPIQMTFEGRNWDILTALTAPLAVWACQRWSQQAKTMAILWNILGLGLLINIAVVSILSTPVPFRVFMNEPANTFITVFPFVLLPVALVSSALVLHVLSLRQWISTKA